jgi:hypothetical protein
MPPKHHVVGINGGVCIGNLQKLIRRPDHINGVGGIDPNRCIGLQVEASPAIDAVVGGHDDPALTNHVGQECRQWVLPPADTL